MYSRDEAKHDLPIALDAEKLLCRSWCFGRDRTLVYAPLLRFAAGGRLIGYRHANESAWVLREGRLLLLDEAGRPTTTFDRISLAADGRMTLEGVHCDGATVHFLREVDADDGPQPGVTDVRLVQRRSVGNRRNLVVLRANEQSLHTRWLQDIEEHDRSWDLCVSYYGAPETFPPKDFSEFAALQSDDRKFTALRKLMRQHTILWDYDYVMFPDDDLQMTWSNINIMFAICHEFELQLAQPSLTASSFINHKKTEQNPDFLLRFVSMVEIMAPIFANQALRRCIDTFSLNQSGFGIDYAWTKLVDGPLTKIAVIDRVAVEHTRPTGQSYVLDAAIEDGYAIAGKFGYIDNCVMRELGGILAHETVDSSKILSDAWATVGAMVKPAG
jgi:hypothetical protein